MVRANGEALYLKVQRELAEGIRTRYRVGDLLPTQVEIARQTGTSLITVKRAIHELGRLGLIESVPGRGAVVLRPVVTDSRDGVSSWTQSVDGSGERADTAWVRIEENRPAARIRRLLMLGAKDRTVLVRRLRTVRGQAISLMTNEIPLKLVPGLVERGLTHESLYECLRRDYGLNPDRASEEVMARDSIVKEREYLGAEVGVVLCVERVTLQEDGSPLEVSHSVNRADLYRYQVNLMG